MKHTLVFILILSVPGLSNRSFGLSPFDDPSSETTSPPSSWTRHVQLKNCRFSLMALMGLSTVTSVGLGLWVSPQIMDQQKQRRIAQSQKLYRQVVSDAWGDNFPLDTLTTEKTFKEGLKKVFEARRVLHDSPENVRDRLQHYFIRFPDLRKKAQKLGIDISNVTDLGKKMGIDPDAKFQIHHEVLASKGEFWGDQAPKGDEIDELMAEIAWRIHQERLPYSDHWANRPAYAFVHSVIEMRPQSSRDRLQVEQKRSSPVDYYPTHFPHPTNVGHYLKDRIMELHPEGYKAIAKYLTDPKHPKALSLPLKFSKKNVQKATQISTLTELELYIKDFGFNILVDSRLEEYLTGRLEQYGKNHPDPSRKDYGNLMDDFAHALLLEYTDFKVPGKTPKSLF